MPYPTVGSSAEDSMGLGSQNIQNKSKKKQKSCVAHRGADWTLFGRQISAIRNFSSQRIRSNDKLQFFFNLFEATKKPKTNPKDEGMSQKTKIMEQVLHDVVGIRIDN